VEATGLQEAPMSVAESSWSCSAEDSPRGDTHGGLSPMPAAARDLRRPLPAEAVAVVLLQGSGRDGQEPCSRGASLRVLGLEGRCCARRCARLLRALARDVRRATRNSMACRHWALSRSSSRPLHSPLHQTPLARSE
jgi:hypothetical protein